MSYRSSIAISRWWATKPLPALQFLRFVVCFPFQNGFLALTSLTAIWEFHIEWPFVGGSRNNVLSGRAVLRTSFDLLGHCPLLGVQRVLSKDLFTESQSLLSVGPWKGHVLLSVPCFHACLEWGVSARTFLTRNQFPPRVSGKKKAKKNRTQSDFFWGVNGGSSFPPRVLRDFPKWAYLKIGQKWPSAKNEGRKTAYFCRTGGLTSRNISKRSVSSWLLWKKRPPKFEETLCLKCFCQTGSPLSWNHYIIPFCCPCAVFSIASCIVYSKYSALANGFL